jgi:hypothetical protein
MRKTLFVLLVSACVLLGAYSAYGIGEYLFWFTETYPSFPNPSCSICHVDPNGGGAPFTSYGAALGVTVNNVPQSQFAVALSKAAAAASICSGYTNGQLINLGINPGTGPCPTPTPAPALTPTPTSIPTMTEWGMIFFMVLAGIGAVYYLKKRLSIYK